MATLNEAFSSLSVRRRYEVWFLRMALADGSGACWFRYLLMNPGRAGCVGDARGAPAQVWATWFPKGDKPRSFIQGYPLESVEISGRGASPFYFRIGDHKIEENSCVGALHVDGRDISWDLQYHSTFHVTLSDKGWIGFSRTPHSDAIFSGSVTIDDRTFAGDPLAFGLQGHNCGYRHRNWWIWTHAYFPRQQGRASTLEALLYEMPFGLVFRKAVLWHDGRRYVLRKLESTSLSREQMQWAFRCSGKEGLRVTAEINGTGPSVHRLPYVKTDCSGHFDVKNNSFSSASILIENAGRPVERLVTPTGAVLEMAGDHSRC